MKFSETFSSLADLPADQLLNDIQAGAVLGIKPSTLSVWRSTGRYHLPYIKTGRLVRYRVADLREFLERRTRAHTSSSEV